MVVVAALTVAAGLGLAAVVSVSDALPGDIANVMRIPEPRDDSNGLMLVDDGPSTSGINEAMVSAAWLLLLVGPPATVLAVVLRRLQSRGQRWAPDWHQVFAAGLVCQMFGLVFSGTFLTLLVWSAFEYGLDTLWETLPGLVAMSSIALFNVWGLRTWRALYRQQEEPPISVTLEDTARQF